MSIFRDTRHPIERELDLRYAAARTARTVEASQKLDGVLAEAIEENKRVPLELKGLKANMLKLQARVDRLNALAMAGDEKGARLEGHLTDIGSQLGAHVDDIEFAANVLGNSGGQSETSSEQGGEQKQG